MEDGQNPPESPNWQYSPEQDNTRSADNGASSASAPASVNWTASEYVAHHKNAVWYLGFALVLTAAAAVIYLFTRDMVSSLVIVVIGIAFGVFAGRVPRVLDYAVDKAGVHIGSRSYPYSAFKSFSVVQEGAINSVTLNPLQRFMPPISIYYDPKDEDQIIKTISNYLAVEERGHDFVDRLMRKVRF
ncbi:hypothetical protein BH23PAT1_BH23PAT1_3640 [soil metagenome]